jgi:hypothetical protein
MLASEVKNRPSRNLFVVEHKEIRHEDTGALEGAAALFPFARRVVAFLSL